MAALTRILSIDGGGIRGVIPGQILITVEEKIQQKTGNPNARIADYFDLVAGTSTGGILTCLYLCPSESGETLTKYSAAEAVDLYLSHGKKIFKSSLWQKIGSLAGFSDEKYSESSLEKLLSGFLGEYHLSDLVKPCLITAYDIENRKSTFFTQHDAVQNPAKDFSLLHVTRSTSAAPTYFQVARALSTSKAAEYSLIDGGVFANNPTLCAFAEVRNKFQDHPSAENMLILSLGTGHVYKSYEYKKAKNWGAIGWIRPLIDILMSGVSETVAYQLTQLFDSVEKPDHYLRIDEELTVASTEMDDASPENLRALQEEGRLAAKKYDAELTQFVEKLVSE